MSVILGLLRQESKKFKRAQHGENSKYVEFRDLDVKLLDTRVLQVKINKDSSSYEVCTKVSQLINLQACYDFRLFLCDQNTERLVEEDENIWKLLEQEPTEKKILQKIFKKNKKKTFLFKKYLWLDRHLEEIDY